MSHPPPLEGLLVIDCSRMLPGAVLARMLLDLGARLIKVEDPVVGEHMRIAPPPVDGMGAGFSTSPPQVVGRCGRRWRALS